MSRKVFIIEDDVNLLSGLTAKISALGLEVIGNQGCGNIHTIMDQLLLSEADYIILDLTLPEVDGCQLLALIKENHEAVKAPVFVFSDMSDTDIKSRCEALGADFYFLKSEFNIDDFAQKVKNIIVVREKHHFENKNI
jgi:DNA-binding NarL/FixJ family response regulator